MKKVCSDCETIYCVCGNKEEVVSFELFKEAINLLEDFILEDHHMDGCHFKTGKLCACMDRGYYNKNFCLIRTREFLTKVSL